MYKYGDNNRVKIYIDGKQTDIYLKCKKNKYKICKNNKSGLLGRITEIIKVKPMAWCHIELSRNYYAL